MPAFPSSPTEDASHRYMRIISTTFPAPQPSKRHRPEHGLSRLSARRSEARLSRSRRTADDDDPTESVPLPTTTTSSKQAFASHEIISTHCTARTLHRRPLELEWHCIAYTDTRTSCTAPAPSQTAQQAVLGDIHHSDPRGLHLSLRLSPATFTHASSLQPPCTPEDNKHCRSVVRSDGCFLLIIPGTLLDGHFFGLSHIYRIMR